MKRSTLFRLLAVAAFFVPAQRINFAAGAAAERILKSGSL
jgi:hypothetical protein